MQIKSNPFNADGMTRPRFKGFGGGYHRADPGLHQGSALSAVMMIVLEGETVAA